MELQKTISPDWYDWVVLNTRNGCTIESMKEMMVENQFDPVFAEAVLQVIRHQEGPSVYLYEPPLFQHTGNSIETSDRTIQIAAFYERPCVAILDNVFSHEECDELIKRSVDKLKRSETVDPVTGEPIIIEERTSSGTFYQLNEDPFISTLDRRISEIMCQPITHGEGLQVLRYGVGAEYKPHFDYFPEEEEGSYKHTANGGQRISTLVVYLNDVEQGGDTYFPEIGLSVKPRKGSAVYFEYCNSLGQVDPKTLHGGAPVIQGEKWIVTKWMRQREYL
jgi:prolyl 4-hydroxylase